mgnify:CR=1 FL=1
MSRVGRLTIEVPKGVTVTSAHGTVTVKGPKGELTQPVRPEVDVIVEDGQVRVERKNDLKPSKSFHGLYRNLVRNMVVGVSEGYSRALTINGVGYRAEVKGKVIQLNLGYSNPIEYVIPEDVTIETDRHNKVTVKGIDKQRVGQVAAELRSLRPPEPYKGKGVKYDTENIRRKVGKSGIK